jgi:O-antigen ligase
MNLPRGRSRVGFSLYTLHLLAVGAIGASNVLLGLLLLATPWWTRERRDELARVFASALPVLAPAALYALLLVMAVIFSVSPGHSAEALSELFSLTTLVLALVWVRGERQARLAVDLIGAAAGLFALQGLAQLAFGYGGIDERIRGPFSHWMTFSGVLLVADLLLVARLAWGGPFRRWDAFWRWLALGAINVALVLSLTRSAWVALAAGLILYAIFEAPRLTRRLVRRPGWLAAAACLALVLVLALPIPVTQRVLSIADPADPSNYDRLAMADAARHMISERPLFGIGPQMVAERYPIYRHPSAPRYWVPHLHDSFLDLAAERGLFALGTYLWLMGVVAAMALERARAPEGASRRDLLLGTVLALAAFNVAALFENNWGDTEVQRVVLFVLALPFVGSTPSPAATGSEEAGTELAEPAA